MKKELQNEIDLANEDDYEEDLTPNRRSSRNLKEDTVLTDKVHEIADGEGKEEGAYDEDEFDNVDIIEQLGQPDVRRSQNNMSTKSNRVEEDIPEDEAAALRASKNSVPAHQQSKIESDVEEDYEF